MQIRPPQSPKPTLGSLFAGIGGFDLGFERAGFKSLWQVEIDPICRAVLEDRFPHAQRFEDVRACGRKNLAPVDCLTAGFPCQDISTFGNKIGLQGARSGLFWEVVRIVDEIQPTWLVLENVAHLLAVNDSRDLETIVRTLAERGYVGFWRVLNARYFGVPQSRRRIFLVAGRGSYPPIELLADAAPVESIPGTLGEDEERRRPETWAAYTLLAANAASRIALGCENLVAYEGGRRAMDEWQRKAEADGLCLGLDEANLAEARAAGNAVVPQVAEWIARKLILRPETCDPRNSIAATARI